MLGRLSSHASHFRVERAGVNVLGIVAVLILGAIASLTTYQVFRHRQSQATQTLPVQPTISSVTALGYLAPQDEIVHLSAPVSNQRVTALPVKEGDRVEVGQIIAVMDRSQEYQASVDNAAAKVRVAQARLARVQAGEEAGNVEAQRRTIARLEAQLAGDREMQQAVLARQQTELAHAEREYQRYQELAQAGAISEAEASSRQLQVDIARTGLREAEARLSEITTTGQEQIEEAEAKLTSLTQVQPADISVAQAELEEAYSQLRQAEATLDTVYVRSPIAGQILRLHTRVGEAVGNQGIAEVGQTDQMYVMAEVYVSDRQYVQVGQTATIVSDYAGFSGELEGVVESMDLHISEPAVVANNPADNTDVRVVGVRIRLRPEDSARVRALNNLEVRAAIHIHQASELSLGR